MAYRVIRFFDDLQDNNYHYNTGDSFPRDGVSVSPARIEELMSNQNKQFRPLIEEVKDTKKTKAEKPADKPVVKPVEETEETAEDKGEINLDTARFFTLKSLAKEHGIDVEGKSAADLREELSKVM